MWESLYDNVAEVVGEVSGLMHVSSKTCNWGARSAAAGRTRPARRGTCWCRTDPVVTQLTALPCGWRLAQSQLCLVDKASVLWLHSYTYHSVAWCNWHVSVGSWSYISFMGVSRKKHIEEQPEDDISLLLDDSFGVLPKQLIPIVEQLNVSITQCINYKVNLTRSLNNRVLTIPEEQ